MAISELGLTSAEVDAIMTDVAGEPAQGAVAPGTPNTNSTVTTTGNTTGSSVKVDQTFPPALVGPGGKSPVAQKAAPSTGIAPAVVGATTGFILGGPVGAAIGAGGMYLLNKVITPK